MDKGIVYLVCFASMGSRKPMSIEVYSTKRTKKHLREEIHGEFTNTADVFCTAVDGMLPSATVFSLGGEAVRHFRVLNGAWKCTMDRGCDSTCALGLGTMSIVLLSV
jgi:ribosomal protein L13